MSQTIQLPPAKYVDAIHGTITRVTRRVEIYESDNTTLWRSSSSIGLLDGEVTVDAGRDERRQLTLELDNSDQNLQVGPNHLWYDKIFKVYRGVRHADGSSYERKLGEFLVDSIDDEHFPRTVSLGARDFTKKLLQDKFVTTTAFAKNQPVENIIRSIAINGGIPSSKMNLPLTGKSTGKDYFFDRTASRWEAIKQIANDYAFDIYFDQEGVLRLEVFADPYLEREQYTFEGGINSNISGFSKSIVDDRIYNHVVVTGGTDDPNGIPPYAIAENNNPESPTRIAKLGRRSYFITSSFMTTQEQCQAVANKHIKLHALEQYNVNVEALVIPYLEAGITVQFIDPNPYINQPTKYLLSSFNIPLDLSAMTANVKRITQVG